MADSQIKIIVTATGAEQAAKVLADIAKSGAQLGSVTVTGAKRAEDALKSLGGAAKRVFEIFAGFSLAGIFTQGLTALRGYIVEMEQLGETALKTERAFASITRGVGVNGDQLLARMKEVSRGLVDQTDIMLSSARAIQQGLAPQQLVDLMALATDRAKTMGVTVAEAFNQMADAITTGNTKALRNAQIMLDADKVYKEFAARLNTVPEALNAGLRSQAIFEAAMRESAKQAKGVTTELDKNVEALERHKIAVADWKSEQGKAFAKAKAETIEYFEDLMLRSLKWLERMGEMRNEWAKTGPLGFLAPKRTGTSFTDDQPWKIPPAPLTGGAKVEGPDALVTAYAKADAALKMLNAQFAAGAITSRAYREGLQEQIGTLQKLGGALDTEGRLKLLALQATLQKFDPGPKLEAMFDDFEDFTRVTKENTDALAMNNAGWVAVAEGIEAADLAEHKVNLDLTNEDLAAQKKTLDDVNAGWVAYADAIEQQDFRDLEAIAEVNAPLRVLSDTLDDIALKGKLLGSSFDTLAPSIAAVEAEIVRLGKAGQDVTALQEQLAGLKQAQELKGIFEDVFSSIGGAINTLVQGVILGTQTMGEAFKRLGQSIVIEFVNRVIQQALNPLMKAAAAVVAGLFAPTSRAAAAALGGAGGVGSDAGGGIVIGGGGSSIPSIPTGAFDVGTLSNAWTSLGSGWTTFNAALDQGASAFTALGEAWDAGSSTFSAVSGAASGLTVGLAGVGAAVAVFGTIMDFVNGKTESAIGGVVGGVAGAVAGGLVGTYIFPGIGTTLGALAGGALGDWLGSMLGGLFGGPSNYQLKRAKAADDANAYLGNTTQGYQSALNTRSQTQLLAALQSTGSGVNPLRTELVLSEATAAKLGITGEREGNKIIARWTNVNEQQMDELLDYFQRNPWALPGAVRGAGDVGYLQQDQAHEFSTQLERGAEALLTAFAGLSAVPGGVNGALTGAMTPTAFYGVARAATDALTQALEEQLAARRGTTDTDALKSIDQSITAMTETVKAWSALVTLYTGLPVEMAAISRDLIQQTDASIEAWRVQMQGFADGIADAEAALHEAIGGGTIIAIQQAAQALHDQTIARYKAVAQAVEAINAAIQGLIEQAAVLADTMTAIGQFEIRSRGSFDTITSLLGSLQDIAEHGDTAAIRLFAVNKAIEAIIRTLPTAIDKFGGAIGPGAITGAVAAGAAPFLATMTDPAQQAQALNALAGAAIAGVQQWAEAAIEGAREAADELIAGLERVRDARLEEIDAEIKGIETEAKRRHELHAAEVKSIQGMAELYHVKAMEEIEAIELTATKAHDARMAEIDAIQAAEDAAHELRAAEMDALQELIHKAEEVESAVKSMGKFIEALKIGPLGPGNPADKAQLAQGNFEEALAAFNRAPTAGGLTDLQDLAQTMLTQQEQVLSKPSPAFQTLSANTIRQLLAAQALLRAQITDSQVLKAQLEHLQAIDKATSAAVKDQVAAIQAADKTAGEKADKLIAAVKERDEKEQAQAIALIKGIEDLDELEQKIAEAMIGRLDENKGQVSRDFQTQTEKIEAAFKAQKLAIETAAGDEIDHIQQGTAAALQANMAVQIPLLEAQYNAANAQLAAIGDTALWQNATLAKLEELRVLLASAVPMAAGTDRIAQDGLAFLHRGEMVIPEKEATRIRSFADGAGLPDPGTVANIVDQWNTLPPAEQTAIIAAFNAQDPATQAAVLSMASAGADYTAAGANTGAWAPGSGDPLRDPWAAHAFQRKDGTWIFEPGYGPGAAPGSVVKLSTMSRPSGTTAPGTTAPTTPYVPPGPGWLTGTDTGAMAMGGGAQLVGGGDVQIIIQLDGKEIGRHGLAAAEISARRGTIHQIIVETRPK